MQFGVHPCQSWGALQTFKGKDLCLPWSTTPSWTFVPSNKSWKSNLIIMPMSAWTFHNSALLCGVRMHLLGRCWMHAAQSYKVWAALVTSRDTSKGSSQGPSWWGSSTGQLRSLRLPQIHAGESPSGIQCMILQASHTQVGPHYPAENS